MEKQAEPFCLHCRSTDLTKRGMANGKQRYACWACGKTSNGVPTPKPKLPCPYCKGRCVKSGRTSDGKLQRYVCTVYHRENTDLKVPVYTYPGYSHRVDLYLDFTAEGALKAYQKAHRLTISQAVRKIFREVLTTPVGRFAVSQVIRMVEGEFREVRLVRPRPLRRKLPPLMALPDARPEATRKTSLQRGVEQHYPTVYVSSLIGVFLDDQAYGSLLTAMQVWNCDHQTAARRLISETRPRLIVRVVGASGGFRESCAHFL